MAVDGGHSYYRCGRDNKDEVAKMWLYRLFHFFKNNVQPIQDPRATRSRTLLKKFVVWAVRGKKPSISQ